MSQMDLSAFLAQAKEYEETGGALDRIFQILNTLDRSHPFNTLRAAELQRWIEAGAYDRILRAEYTRRGPEAEGRPLERDLDEAREHYMKEAKAVGNDVVDTAKRAAQAFRKGGRQGGGVPTAPEPHLPGARARTRLHRRGPPLRAARSQGVGSRRRQGCRRVRHPRGGAADGARHARPGCIRGRRA